MTSPLTTTIKTSSSSLCHFVHRGGGNHFSHSFLFIVRFTFATAREEIVQPASHAFFSLYSSFLPLDIVSLDSSSFVLKRPSAPAAANAFHLRVPGHGYLHSEPQSRPE